MTTQAREELPRNLRQEFDVPLWKGQAHVVAVYEDNTDDYHQWHRVSVRCEKDVLHVILYNGVWNINDDCRSFSVHTRNADVKTSVGPVAVCVEVRSEAGRSARLHLCTAHWEHTLMFELTYDGCKFFDGWE